VIIPQYADISNVAVSATDNLVHGSCGDNAVYSFDETTGTLTISGTGDMWSFSNYTTPPWTDFKDKIVKVVIEDGITSIGQYSFSNCKNLTSVDVTNDITVIGAKAFYSCTNLTSIDIPINVTDIGSYAFYNCSSLSTVSLPDQLAILGDDAFGYCTAMGNITIPSNVTSIGRDVFLDCASMDSITILSKDVSIETNAIGKYSVPLTEENFPNASINITGDPSITAYTVVKMDDFTIYGYTGSSAEKYATSYEFNFVALDEDNQTEETPLEDNKPTATDILKLKKYLFGISSDSTNLDYNNDGNVNILDLIYIKQQFFED
jgi:hypothetical protein